MKILLLSDVVMNKNAGGVAQTLHNLLLFSEPKNLLCISPNDEFVNSPPSPHYMDRYLTYKFNFFSHPKNRLSKYLTTVIDFFNVNINNRRSFNLLRKQINLFSPDIIISCSNGPVGLYMHFRLTEDVSREKIFPYFMDDWMNITHSKWLRKKVYAWTRRILSENSAWLMISHELSAILQDRYSLSPNRVLEVHNPVDLSNIANFDFIERKKNKYTLAYGGSLWEMHYDAFIVVAKSVLRMRENREVELIVYTSLKFWEWRKDDLELYGVTYGGNIPYDKIHQKFSEADALILTSSFLESYITHSQGSKQTKLTDYMKSKRLIISCGPSYSANHNFLKKYECGYCIETTEINEVTSELNFALDNIDYLQYMPMNAIEVLKDNFSLHTVHSKLLQFLTLD